MSLLTGEATCSIKIAGAKSINATTASEVAEEQQAQRAQIAKSLEDKLHKNN